MEQVDHSIEVCTVDEGTGRMAAGHVVVQIPVATSWEPAIQLVSWPGDSPVEFLSINRGLYEPVERKRPWGLEAADSALISATRMTSRQIDAMYRDIRDIKRKGNDLSRDMSDTALGRQLQALAAKLILVDGFVYTPTLGPVIAFDEPPIRPGQQHDASTQYNNRERLEARHFLGRWTSADQAYRTSVASSMFSWRNWRQAQALSEERAELYGVKRESLHPRRAIRILSKNFDGPDEAGGAAANVFCDEVLRGGLERQTHDVSRSFVDALFHLRLLTRNVYGADVLGRPRFRRGIAVADAEYPHTMLPAAVRLVEELAALPHKGMQTKEIGQWHDLIRTRGYAQAVAPEEDLAALGFEP